jgi:hypothetical protein
MTGRIDRNPKQPDLPGRAANCGKPHAEAFQVSDPAPITQSR